MKLGEPLASGRDADVYALDARRVLRRYRAGGDVTDEAAVMIHVGEYGYPVPRVVSAQGADMVMQRLSGPTMFQSLAAGELVADAAGELLADLHNRLHLLPARLSTDTDVRILHLDLHPGNVMICAHGPMVIDWRNTKEGAPDVDVALSALILAEVAAGDRRASKTAREVLDAFVQHVDADLARSLDEAVALRRNDPNLNRQELDQLQAAADLVLAAL